MSRPAPSVIKPTQTEIQRAHDVLWAVVMGEARIDLAGAGQPAHASLDTLCWILGHDHGLSGFAVNLRAIEDMCIMAGYVLTDSGAPG